MCKNKTSNRGAQCLRKCFVIIIHPGTSGAGRGIGNQVRDPSGQDEGGGGMSIQRIIIKQNH